MALVTGNARFRRSELAEICDLSLDILSQTDPMVTVFFCEVLLAAATDPDIVDALAPWLEDQLTFWRYLTSKLDDTGLKDDTSEVLAQALVGLSIDEMAHGAALGSLPEYLRMRRMAIGCLCNGKISDFSSHSNGKIFQYLFEALGAVDDPIAIDKGKHEIWDNKLVIYSATAAHLLVNKGAGAVTYRAVAELAGVATSTLAYHFKTRESLIKGAMVYIIRHLKGEFPEDILNMAGLSPMDAVYEISRSTFALALQARRDPLFLGSAADMRRKRGINFKPYLNARLEPHGGVSDLGAQTLAIVSIGTIMGHAHQGIDKARQASQILIEKLIEI